MVCLWICAGSADIRIAALFDKCALDFCRTYRIFTAKGTAIRGFTRRCTAARQSKCGASGGRKAVHMPPCFQVPLRHVCCIRFDAYCISKNPHMFIKHSFLQTRRIFTAKGAAIRQKAPQPLDCGALQDGALQHGHHSAAHPWIAGLYKTVHCSTAIIVRHFWWEKSSAHAAMFSSAAATRLLDFLTRTIHGNCLNQSKTVQQI